MSRNRLRIDTKSEGWWGPRMQKEGKNVLSRNSIRWWDIGYEENEGPEAVIS